MGDNSRHGCAATMAEVLARVMPEQIAELAYYLARLRSPLMRGDCRFPMALVRGRRYKRPFKRSEQWKNYGVCRPAKSPS
jgi:hypothetical protein